MALVTVGVEGRRSTVGCRGEVSQSPRFSASLIGLRSLGFCGGTVGMANIGSRVPACPPFITALRERGPTAIHGRRPRSGRGSDQFSDPEITFLTFFPLISISYLYLDNQLIHKSVHRAHCIMTVSYVLSDTMTTIHLSVLKWILV
jgi:hypothetical protein